MRIFLKKRPNVVVSTGAGIALATCFLAKMTGKTLYLLKRVQG
jgi:UDP-N-acetylglucosamine:LPS N-acetylglucosamine transferase